MVILIIGTPGSGKSKKAEDIIRELSCGEDSIYLATMIPFGREGEKRIEKHRKMREGKGFITIEKPDNIDEIVFCEENDIKGRNCLLECVSNLVGNEMHAVGNEKLDDNTLVRKITASIKKVSKNAKNLVIVANYFNGDNSFDDETLRYISLNNMTNELLREEADKIYELKEGEWILSEHN